MRNNTRKQLYVDKKVQTALVARVVFYWFVCMASVSLLVCLWELVAGGLSGTAIDHLRSALYKLLPAVVASALVLPLLIVDILKLSNRFAGPLVRFRRALDELAAGRSVEKLSFREGDFWQEMADQLNAVAERMDQHESQRDQFTLPEEACQV